MPLADDADVQKHLPIDKIKVEEIPDDLARQKEYAERIIRGYLSDVVDPLVLALWIEPEDTPDIIRECAGLFTASLIYRTRFSENALGDPEFAQNKYNEAMAILMGIINDEIDIPGVEDIPSFDNTMFSPNNDSDDPRFTMADRY